MTSADVSLELGNSQAHNHFSRALHSLNPSPPYQTPRFVRIISFYVSPCDLPPEPGIGRPANVHTNDNTSRASRLQLSLMA